MKEEEPNRELTPKRSCPGCGKEIVSHNKSRKFCNEICYNIHYNTKVRNDQIHRLQQQDYNVVAIRTLIGESTQTIVPIAALDSIGFRFDLYSNLVKHTPISESYYVWYGPYRLNLTPEYQIQIILKDE